MAPPAGDDGSESESDDDASDSQRQFRRVDFTLRGLDLDDSDEDKEDE